MTTMDYRIAVRRHTVREAGSRRRLGHLLLVIGFFLVVGLIALLLQSPVMAVRDIEVIGAEKADVVGVLERYNVVPGVPTISVRPEEIQAQVEADPWVARAKATITWPGTVAITVLEYEPVAWVKIDGEWYRASATGAIVEQSNPVKAGARVVVGSKNARPGDTLNGKRVTAALEFLAALPNELRRKAVITAGADGTLVGRVQGHLVDIGSPTDMREKAATLTAILADGIAERAAVSVVSPYRPAIRNPKGTVEG